MLIFVNALSLIHHCVSRPFNDTLLNVHTILNDIGVLIVLGELYRFRYPFLSDAEFYFLGKVVMGTIAGIIFLNFVLFILSFLLGCCAFCKKYACCKKKQRDKEGLIVDPDKDISKSSIDEVEKPPTPPEPSPPPTPPREKTPPLSPPESIKDPTPEESEEEPEYNLPAAAVLVKD